MLATVRVRVSSTAVRWIRSYTPASFGAGADGAASANERLKLTGRDPQYACAHTASATLGLPHHIHVLGASGERNSGSGSTRTVAAVCCLVTPRMEWASRRSRAALNS